MPPAPPTNISGTSAFTTIFLAWLNPADIDLASVEIWSATSNDSSKATLLSIEGARPSTPGTFTHSGLTSGATLYYWLKAVDTSGNKSPFSVSSGVVRTAFVDISDVAPAVNQGITKTVTALPDPVNYTGAKLVLLSTDGKLYRYVDGKWTSAVSTADLSEKITNSLIDSRGLDIKALDGVTIFGSAGTISDRVTITTPDGAIVSLSTVAANALTPSLYFVGEFATPPTQAQLGTQWRQNAVYKNSTDARSYVLTGEPLGWQIYLVDGTSFDTVIESSAGTVFRVGQATTTLLKCRVFKNGAEITDSVPEGWFRGRRVSGLPQLPPNDDATWNAKYAQGYKQISISIDDIKSRATFFVDIQN